MQLPEVVDHVGGQARVECWAEIFHNMSFLRRGDEVSIFIEEWDTWLRARLINRGIITGILQIQTLKDKKVIKIPYSLLLAFKQLDTSKRLTKNGRTLNYSEHSLFF